MMESNLLRWLCYAIFISLTLSAFVGDHHHGVSAEGVKPHEAKQLRDEVTTLSSTLDLDFELVNKSVTLAFWGLKSLQLWT